MANRARTILTYPLGLFILVGSCFYMKSTLDSSPVFMSRTQPAMARSIGPAKTVLAVQKPNDGPTQGIQDEGTKICTSQQRLQYIRNTCTEKEKHINDKLGGEYVFDHARKIMFCSIGKNGGTTWRMIMAKNTKEGPTIAPDFNPKTWIHGKIGLFGLEKKQMNRKIYEKVQNYTKFVIWRHPFDRLLSAYHDKAKPRLHPRLNTTYPLFHTIQKYALNNFHPDLSRLPNGGKDYIPSFKEFVNFARDNPKDPHWLPQLSQCNFCAIDYDYVLRIETMSHDCELLTSNHFKEVNSCPNHNPSRNTASRDEVATTSKLLGAFSELSHKESLYLDKRFRPDLDRLGYQFDKVSNKATCSIKVDDGTTCC